MLQRDLYWLAGWLEGEGSFTFYTKLCGDGNTRRNWHISGTSTDEDVLQRVADLLKVRLLGPYIAKQNPDFKPYWRIDLSRRRDVLAVCEALFPLMGARRQEQIQRLLDANVEFPERRSFTRKRRTLCI